MYQKHYKMKYSILTIICFTALSFFSNGRLGELVPAYSVVYDSLESKIPAGKCLITGKVTRAEVIINEALIYTKSGVRVNTNKEGRFRMLIDTSDTYLVIHKAPHQDGFVEGYKFESQHHVEILIFMPEEYYMIEAEKPVIYAYSNDKIEINLNLSPKGEFTFTYPQIDKENEWNFTSTKNGEIYINNKSYPYLFWESITENLKYHKQQEAFQGEVVKSNMIITYLETELSQMGLNATEKADFITYWGPRMTESNYSLIQFKVDEQYDEIATINVTPKPDNIRRVYMLFTPFDSYPSHLKIDNSKVKYTSISRDGLTIIEWGGSQIPEQQLNKQL